MTTRLERLLQQRAELEKAIENAAKKHHEKEKKRDTQRKIIFGAWCMMHRPELLKEFMENGLVRPYDKAQFSGWTPPTGAPITTAQAEANA